MPVSMHKRARWMGPAMIVLAGIVAGAPAGADGRASDDVVEIPEWRSAFETSGVSGTIVLRRLGDRRSFVSDLDTAERGLPPASTFKLPHLLIALETGVMRDAGPITSGPELQQITAAIGAERMADWLHRLNYGNAGAAGGSTRFLMNDSLRVTPVQQVDFVERLLLGTLPASARSQTVARDIVPGEPVGCDAVFRAKSSWAPTVRDNGEEAELGWLVGWVEMPREVWLFATAIEGDPALVRSRARQVTLDVFSRLGIGDETNCAPAPSVAAITAEPMQIAELGR